MTNDLMTIKQAAKCLSAFTFQEWKDFSERKWEDRDKPRPIYAEAAFPQDVPTLGKVVKALVVLGFDPRFGDFTTSNGVRVKKENSEDIDGGKIYHGSDQYCAPHVVLTSMSGSEIQSEYNPDHMTLQFNEEGIARLLKAGVKSAALTALAEQIDPETLKISEPNWPNPALLSDTLTPRGRGRC